MKLFILIKIYVFVETYSHVTAYSVTSILTRYDTAELPCKFLLKRYPIETVEHITWYKGTKILKREKLSSTTNIKMSSERYTFEAAFSGKYINTKLEVSMMNCKDSGTSYKVVIRSKNTSIPQGRCKKIFTVSNGKIHRPSASIFGKFCGNVPENVCNTCHMMTITNSRNFQGVRFSNSTVAFYAEANYVHAKWSNLTWYRFVFSGLHKENEIENHYYPSKDGKVYLNDNPVKGQCDRPKKAFGMYVVNLANRTTLSSYSYELHMTFELSFGPRTYYTYFSARLCLIDPTKPLPKPGTTGKPLINWMPPTAAKIEKTSPVLVVEDKPLNLLCTITDGKPSVNLFWQLNKISISNRTSFNISKTKSFKKTRYVTFDSDRKRLEDLKHTSNLTFIPLYSLRNSRVRCGAKNKANENNPIYSNSFLVQPYYKPRISIDKHFIEYTFGEKFNFTCTIDSYPEPIISYWKFRGLPRNHSGTYNVDHGDDRHDGEYICYAENYVGSSKKSLHAKYLRTKRKSNLTYLRFDYHPYNYVFAINRASYVNCSILTHERNDTLEMTMYFENHLIAKNGAKVPNPLLIDYRVIYERNKKLLIRFPNISLKHEGWYRCSVEKLPSKIGLYTAGNPPQKPVLQVPAGKIIAAQVTEVTCSQTGGRPISNITIKLIKNGTVLPGRVKLIKTEVPFEPYGTVTARAEVHFEQHDVNTVLICIAYSYRMSNNQSTTYNVTTIYTKPVVAINTNAPRLGGKLRITCVVTGFPKGAVVLWYHKNSIHRKYVKNNTIVKNNAALQDNGEWTCKAENSIGTTNATITVGVLASPVVTISANKPHINEELRIICLVRGTPKGAVVAWYHNNKIHQRYVKNNEIKNSHASFQDNGEWTCTAKNVIGSTNATVTVVVLDPAPKDLSSYIPLIATIVGVVLLICAIAVIAFLAFIKTRQRKDATIAVSDSLQFNTITTDDNYYEENYNSLVTLTTQKPETYAYKQFLGKHSDIYSGNADKSTPSTKRRSEVSVRSESTDSETTVRTISKRRSKKKSKKNSKLNRYTQ